MPTGCNKYHLLHLVGILFPHYNDDARSKSLQILYIIYKYRTISSLKFKILHSSSNFSSYNGVAKSQNHDPVDEKSTNLRRANISYSIVAA